MWSRILLRVSPLNFLKSTEVKSQILLPVLTNNDSTQRLITLKATTAEEKWTFPSPYSDVHIAENVSLTQFIFDKQEKHADKPAFVNGETGQIFTHLETRELILKLGSALSKLGISQGDIIAVVSPNCPEFVFSFLGIIVSGGIPSPVNFSFTAEELRIQLQNSNCVAVICHGEKTSVVQEACQDIPTIRHIISFKDEQSQRIISLKKLLQDDGKSVPNNLKINQNEDVVAMPYSSGTSGLPKGVMLTHRNIVANLHQMLHPDVCFFNLTDNAKQEVILGIIPLYHIYGLVLNMALVMCLGAKLVTMKEFEQNKFVNLLKKYEPTLLPLVPPLISFAESSKLVSPDMLNTVHTIVCGAAPLGETLIEKFFKKFGRNIRFIEGYGLTETSPVALASRKDQYIIGSCGVPIPNTFMKLVNVDSGETIDPKKEQGELCIKGPQVMKGYYNNEKATRDTIDREGWFHTGDIARIDEEGNVFILDRLKELIKVKGLQVAPAELENLLREHTLVEDVAVIGIPDDRAGEVPRAYVVPKKGGRLPSEQELITFVENRVSRHKCIKSVIFIEEIPQSASGKILRRNLRNT